MITLIARTEAAGHDDVVQKDLIQVAAPCYNVRRYRIVRRRDMVTATITSKGQITIPKNVRVSLHLHTGDRVAFVVHGHSEAILTPITRSVDEVYGTLFKKGAPTRSVDQMNKAIRRRMREHQS